ncbi:protein SET DOMAIN GROUP 41 isoform X1 [Actinidia eriantha]|uniref:protein SET DOMAIN GROUP 41 isoform X1 n=1 Tax=Actinidia eriantha TaxID=165200 RepID=UPI0025860346|nr:protein SET DOMAIN GROUP 41 isoform X1 [Actinidia eriantha]
MEMRASEDVGLGQDLTPPLPPLAFSLLDSSLLSHCSACFSPLSPPPPRPLPHPSALYCSPQCSKADAAFHLSSAENHLLLHHLGGDDTTDLRVALRLLRRFELLNLIPPQSHHSPRIGGLMTHRDELMTFSDEDEQNGSVLERIRDGAKAMAVARRMRDGLDLEFSGECVLEEAVLCSVLTNAVEVQVNGGHPVGIAVYGMVFSWINHSCSPNSCYWFPLPGWSGGNSRLRIVRASGGIEVRENGDRDNCESTIVGEEYDPRLRNVCAGGGIEVRKNGDFDNCESKIVDEEYGPRIVVRSIKAINKGEEVSVAYTDLLQPRAMRQSELWLKYRFICSCQRCSSLPPTYVDRTLQEISAVNCNCANLSSGQNFYIDEAIKRSSDYVDDAITEYLEFGNPKSCCEKLENLLTGGLLDGQFEPKEGKSKQQFWLHPLHHLSLSAYTTLASAYKFRASELLALDPEKCEHQMEAFNMNRTSAAYSLLVAGATHHLFLFEPSLIASVANFWINAGEHLLNVARSPIGQLITKCGLTVAELPSSPSYKCCKCALVGEFETNVAFSRGRNVVFEDTSWEFLNCVTSITPKLWTFLIHRGGYLQLIKDPIDFRWIGTTKSLSFEVNLAKTDAESSVSEGEARIWINQENINLFRLGVHCLLYGDFLLSICGGKQSHLDRSVLNLLHS